MNVKIIMTIGCKFNGEDIPDLNRPSRISRAEIGKLNRVACHEFSHGYRDNTFSRMFGYPLTSRSSQSGSVIEPD